MTEADNDEPGVLRIEHTFEAPIARVFEAWSNPDVMKHWIWGSLGKEVTAEGESR